MHLMPGMIKNIFNKLRRRGIFFRTFLILMILSVTLIALFAFMVIPREKSSLLKAMESQAQNITASISEATSSAFLNGDYGAVVEHNMHLLERSRDIHYIIAVRENGFSIVNILDQWETRDQPNPRWQQRELSRESGIIESSLVGKPVYHYSAPLQFSGYDWGHIYIGTSLHNYDQQVRQNYRVILYLSALCLIFAALLSYYFAKRLTQPIRSLRHTTQRIMEGDLTARADIPPDDEVGELAMSFNSMTDQMVASRKKIQDSFDELEVYRKNLETLVRRRTEELTAANQLLQAELSERMRAEKALVESEKRYRVIFETAGNASIIVEADNTIIMVNGAFEQLSGYARRDVEGKRKWGDFLAVDDQKMMERPHVSKRQKTQGAREDFETAFVDRDGNRRSVFLTMAEIPGTGRTIISLTDMTEIKKLEAQLLQSQKMEAVGQLAGGVAHDFNNILTAIIGYASLLKMNVKKDKAMLAYVNPIMSSAERASHLTQGLLAFSRKQVIEPRHVDLNEIIRKVQNLLHRLLGEDVEIHITYTGRPVTIFADVGQMEQILLNLATNARDAMREGGLLSITTDTTVFTDDDASESAYEKKPGKYAVISVSDTGEGMSKETINHIFEPFFTTKEVGKGTGLGLSIVYGIIKQHNGYINVYSEPGTGTTFRIYFPLVKAMAEEDEADQPMPDGGVETILVAEDDDVTRELSRLVLEKFGYTVIESTDGEDAVEKFRQNQHRVDLVLLDVMMPRLNGKAAYDQIQSIKPGVKALFISGYTADIIHKKGIIESSINFISKPVKPDQLARKIRDILDAN